MNRQQLTFGKAYLKELCANSRFLPVEFVGFDSPVVEVALPECFFETRERYTTFQTLSIDLVGGWLTFLMLVGGQVVEEKRRMTDRR